MNPKTEAPGLPYKVWQLLDMRNIYLNAPYNKTMHGAPEDVN